MTLLTQTTKELAPAQLMPAWTPRRRPARRPLLHHAAGRHPMRALVLATENG